MDSIRLNMLAVDQIHPCMLDLLQSLNKIETNNNIEECKSKIKEWYLLL